MGQFLRCFGWNDAPASCGGATALRAVYRFIHHNILSTTAMQKPLLITLTALAILAGGSLACGPFAGPAKASVLCGGNGCNVIQTKPLQRRKFQTLGYTKPLQQTTPPAPATTITPKL